MKPFLLAPVIAALTLLLISCAGSPSSNSAGSDGAEKWKQFTGNLNLSLRRADSLEGLKIPLVSSPALDRAWGPPLIQTTTAGHYRLSYRSPRDPFERLVIYGSPTPFPALRTPPSLEKTTMLNDELGSVEVGQVWRVTAVLGRPVRWFTESQGGGTDGGYYSTEGFTLRHPSGSLGHYRLVIESVSNAQPSRFQTVSW